MTDKKIIGSKNIKTKRKVASLNMIATFLTALKIIETHDINTSKIYCRVSKEAAGIVGHKAGLQEGDILTIYDLFFGKKNKLIFQAMMLPSGNDAALCLAQTLGYLGDNPYLLESKFTVDNPISAVYTRSWQSFVSKMNKLKYEFNMSSSTNFCNPHGLTSLTGCTTVEDMTRLCLKFLENRFCSEVASTR